MGSPVTITIADGMRLGFGLMIDLGILVFVVIAVGAVACAVFEDKGWF